MTGSRETRSHAATTIKLDRELIDICHMPLVTTLPDATVGQACEAAECMLGVASDLMRHVADRSPDRPLGESANFAWAAVYLTDIAHGLISAIPQAVRS